jgi:hypothetical protein
VADACVESFGKAVAAGVKIAMGTDLGNKSGENLAGLVAMRRPACPRATRWWRPPPRRRS